MPRTRVQQSLHGTRKHNQQHTRTPLVTFRVLWETETSTLLYIPRASNRDACADLCLLARSLAVTSLLISVIGWGSVTSVTSGHLCWKVASRRIVLLSSKKMKLPLLMPGQKERDVCEREDNILCCWYPLVKKLQVHRSASTGLETCKAATK